jgi:hypothetical protein
MQNSDVHKSPAGFLRFFPKIPFLPLVPTRFARTLNVWTPTLCTVGESCDVV